MKVLLDENLPEQLKADLGLHEVYTAREMGWKGKKNGELLQLLTKERFDTLLTSDKNLQHQQNLKKYSFAVLLLDIKLNTYPAIQPIIPKILSVLNSKLNPGITSID